MEREKLILGIDYNNLLMGSFFGSDLINTKGQNVNAIKGFFFRFNKIKEFLNPDYIIIANDLGRTKTFRRKMYRGYKATRTTAPEGLSEQLRYGLQLLYFAGFPILNHQEYEADDILGMVSKFSSDNGYKMVIASSDRDYYQLVNDDVTIFSTRKNQLIDRAWIKQEYGLEPEQLKDLKALAGDRSDNIPGAYGIGDTTALKLMQRYGSLEQIYFHKALLPPKIQSSLENSREQVKMSKILGTILTDYSLIELTEDKLTYQPYRDPTVVFSLLSHLELNSLIGMMRFSLLPSTNLETEPAINDKKLGDDH